MCPRQTATWLALLVQLAAGACSEGKDDPSTLRPGDMVISTEHCPMPASDQCESSDPPSYARVVAPIVARRCVTCHTGLGDAPWPLDTHGNLSAWKGEALQQLYRCTMPPADAGVPFTEGERTLLWEWLVCGAPNN
jgi:uncharacterized membrane protein